jgi:hypothetical protein
VHAEFRKYLLFGAGGVHKNTFYLVQVEFRKYLRFGAGGVQKISSIRCRWSSENTFYLGSLKASGTWTLSIKGRGQARSDLLFIQN